MTYSYFISVDITSESSPDLSGLASQGSVTETATELLNSQDPLFPPLMDCTHPIESIAARLTTELKWLVQSLCSVEARMMVEGKVVGRFTKFAVHHHRFVM
jgi:hypothetical protein